jgi:hypothetical protein
MQLSNNTATIIVKSTTNPNNFLIGSKTDADGQLQLLNGHIFILENFDFLKGLPLK